jgi:hypothetical protein
MLGFFKYGGCSSDWRNFLAFVERRTGNREDAEGILQAALAKAV